MTHHQAARLLRACHRSEVRANQDGYVEYFWEMENNPGFTAVAYKSEPSGRVAKITVGRGSKRTVFEGTQALALIGLYLTTSVDNGRDED